MTMKIYLWIPIFLLAIVACNTTEQKKVSYQGTKAISAYDLYYTDANQQLHDIEVEAKSAQDIWTLEFMADPGAIVYLSGKYEDDQSALKLLILIDGKVYKQAENQGDTLKFLTVSGSIPYD